MKNNTVEKVSFIVIIVLLLLFLPLTGYSIYLKINNVEESAPKENKQKEFYFDGKLWFYDTKSELLGTYECKESFCGYGVSYENEKDYSLDYVEQEVSTLPIINERYAFIKDSNTENTNEVNFYDLKNPDMFKGVKYASVKNYQVGIENNMFIVESQNHKFGVLQITDMPSLIIPFSYDYLGLVNNVNENGELIADYFVALIENEWMILDKSEARLTKNITNPIVSFSGENIITKDAGNNYQLVDYNGNDVLKESFENLKFIGKYLECTTNDSFYIYDINNKKSVSQTHAKTRNDKIRTVLTEKNTIEIYINEKLAETVR